MKQVYYAPQTCRRPSLGHCDCHCHTPPAHPGLQEKGGLKRTSSMHNVGAGFGGVACDILYRVACVRAQETSYVSVSYIPSRSSDFLLLAAGSESSPVGQHAERVTPSKRGGGTTDPCLLSWQSASATGSCRVESPRTGTLCPACTPEGEEKVSSLLVCALAVHKRLQMQDCL